MKRCKTTLEGFKSQYEIVEFYFRFARNRDSNCHSTSVVNKQYLAIKYSIAYQTIFVTFSQILENVLLHTFENSLMYRNHINDKLSNSNLIINHSKLSFLILIRILIEKIDFFQKRLLKQTLKVFLYTFYENLLSFQIKCFTNNSLGTSIPDE